MEITRKPKARSIAIIAGAAVAVAAATAFFLAPKGDSAIGTGEASSSVASPEQAVLPPADITDSSEWKSLPEDLQNKLNKLRVMSPAEFAVQAKEDKLQYGSLLMDVYQDWALRKAKDNNYANEHLAVDTIPVISPNNTGQEIVNNAAITRCVQWYSLTVTSRGGPGRLSSDRTDAQKLEALRVSTESKIYAIDTDQLMSQTEFRNTMRCGADMIVVSESPIKESAGVVTKIVQGSDEYLHETSQETYEYTTFADYKGQQRATWLLKNGISPTDPSWIAHLGR